MLEPESQDPAQGAAGHRVQPPLGLPSQPQPPSVPHQASQPPCRIPRARWAAFQSFYPEPWGQLQVARAQLGLPFPVNVGSPAMDMQPGSLFTEPSLGVRGHGPALPEQPLGTQICCFSPWCPQAQLPAPVSSVPIALAQEQQITGSRCLVATSQGLGTAAPPATLCNSWSTCQDRSHDGAAGQEPGPALLSGEALCPQHPSPPSALYCALSLSTERDPSPITGTCKVWLFPPLN